jgi:hypothetical protein
MDIEIGRERERPEEGDIKKDTWIDRERGIK